VGKLFVFTGDMDTYYLNNSSHVLHDFLEGTTDPYYGGFFMFAPRKPHCWSGPFSSQAERLRYFALHIAKNTPKDIEVSWWKW
jgi:hypothetical protein